MAQLLKFFRLPYFVALIAATVFFGKQCLELTVDQENRSMNTDNSIADLIEKDFHDRFNEGEPLLVAVHHHDLLGKSGRQLVDKITREFWSVEGVREVSSIVDSNYRYPPYHENLMVSHDKKTLGIRVLLDEIAEDNSLQQVIENLQALAKANSFDDGVVILSGLPLQKYEAARLVLKDQKLFAPMSFIVLACVLLLVTRRVTGVLFPLTVAGITTAWTLGIYSLAGFQLNMITSLLAPVILTLSVSTVLHVYLHWIKGDDKNKYHRILTSAKSLYRPCLFASLTTAAGFLSLLLSDTPAVRQFGTFAAVGVILAYIIGFTLLLFGLSILKPPAQKLENDYISFSLLRFATIAIAHPWKIIVFTFALAAGTFFGIERIQINTDLLDFLGVKNQVHKDTMYINTHLTGVNTIEVLLSKALDDPFSSQDDIDKIQNLCDRVLRFDDVRHVLGLPDFLDERITIAGNPQATFNALAANPQSLRYLDSDRAVTRISIRTNPIGTSAGQNLVDRIRLIAHEELGEEITAQLSGGFVRVIEESNHLVASQMKSFGFALGFILVAIGIVFRSLQLMFLSIIPNVVPLLITGAVMGLCQIDLSTGTAMITGVVIGVAVDDTIHYLTEFKKRLYTKGCDRAILETALTSGVALFSTTLALSLGFWVAALGSFKPTIHFALLSGFTMWVALICDVLLLPAFLKITYRKFTGLPDHEQEV